MILVALAAGLIIGSLLGDLLSQLVTSSWLRELLTLGPTVGISPPATVDLRLLSVTFGIVIKVNIVGVLGILIAFVALRRY